MKDLHNQVKKSFAEYFHEEPTLLVRAPGRVNLIGGHTDYNDGFVLPIAIDRAVWIALRVRPDRQVVVHSTDFEETGEFSLDDLQRGQGWLEYLKGMAQTLQQAGYTLRGWEGVMAGDVPIGAGLSSSAATEMAVARAFMAVSGFDWDPVRMAAAGQRCENEWIGVNSGIMDQMASALAQAGQALFLDCRTLAYEQVPLPQGLAVVVMDTATRRGLVGSAYNQRRSQCEAAAHVLGVKALRDANLDQLQAAEDKMDEITFRRARHIITENQRVLHAVQAMHAGEVVRLGRLLDASHASLRDDFEVSNLALDQMVACARQQAGYLGARMTGAGFGGCAVALVREADQQAFVGHVLDCYHRTSGLEPNLYPCQASQGASLERYS
jgi:galactokinase